MWQQAKFNDFIIEHNVIGFFERPVVLKSGRRSCWYVNWRTVTEDVFLTEQLAEFVVKFIDDSTASKKIVEKPLCIYGVPEGASKLSIVSQYLWAKREPNYGSGSHPLAMGRKLPKEHGDPKDRYFVGSPRGATIVLEDVTTTGGSLLSTIDSLNESGIKLIGAMGLTNRMEKRDDGDTVQQAIERKASFSRPIPYLHMSSALDLLPEAANKLKPPKDVIVSIESEFREFGSSELKFQ